MPVDGHAAVAVGRPGVPAAAAPVVATAAPVLARAAPVLLSASSRHSGRVLDADVALHACVALALLGGHAPAGCALPAGSPTPSLADALRRVGLCARVAVLAASR